MKIALLNLPFDNNYGGNLQRYALMKVLEEMGHDVTHLYTCFDRSLPGRYPLLSLCKRIMLRLLGRNEPLFRIEYNNEYKAQKTYKMAFKFYHRYIKHTKAITPYSDISKYNYFDAYIVGSDQVWRRSMSYWFPFKYMFLNFIENLDRVKRIAYAVSFGTSEDEIPDGEKPYLNILYEKFDAVSVREDSGLDLLDKYGWTTPRATQSLDPTLLLSRDHYENLIRDSRTHEAPGNMFCYILDSTEEVETLINRISRRRKLTPFGLSLEGTNNVSVSQWLRFIKDSEYIVTDSYHGFVFSIIFNKPVKLIYNKRRGNERFESLMRLLNYNPDSLDVNWRSINERIDAERIKSMFFLKSALQ